jgi:hypothetical protein
MKPVVFYDVEKYDDDEKLILIDREKFEKLLDDTYQAGVEDGRKVNQVTYYPSGVRGINPNWTLKPCDMPRYENDKPLINDTTITC